MNILLFGNMSGFQTSLKDGLRELGHQVQLISPEDGWKKIPGVDINLGHSVLENFYRLLKHRDKLKGYDVVQFSGPILFGRPGLGVNAARMILSRIRDANTKKFLSVAGCSSIKWSAIDRFRYHPYDDFVKFDAKGKTPWWEKEAFARWDREFSMSMDGIIPVCCEYSYGYEGMDNARKMIPLPVNVSDIKYRENKAKGKLIIFHGLSRYGFKGTRHIEKAFDAINSKYPNDVECVIKGKLPLTTYLSLMESVNVVVDQAYSYSAGMNALFAMAMGKVVLGGAEPESLMAMDVSKSPIINIMPDPKDIEDKIEAVLARRHEMAEMGQYSRQFVEENHSHILIAQKYVDEWNH